MDEFLYHPYARAVRGEKVLGEISGRKYKRVSIVTAKELSLGHVIVMDNAAFHCKAVLQNLAEKAGCSLLFLPPYSPDLNWIENSWVWLKRTMRSLLPLYASFHLAILRLFQLV